MKDIGEVIKDLKHKDSSVRRYAVERLEMIGDEKAVDSLISVLKDKNRFVRQDVIAALGKIGGARLVEPLTQALEDERDEFVKDSIIMDGAVIGQDSIIDHSILDKEVLVEPGCHIGFGNNFQVNRSNPRVLSTGLTIVGKRTVVPSGYKIGRNCIIYDNVAEDDFPEPETPSGETVRPKRKPIRIRA